MTALFAVSPPPVGGDVPPGIARVFCLIHVLLSGQLIFLNQFPKGTFAGSGGWHSLLVLAVD